MTNSDAIRELTRATAVLEQRLINVQDGLARIDGDRRDALTTLIEVDKRLAILEQSFAEVRRVGEEKDRRRSMVVVAFLGSLLTLLVNVALIFLKK